MKNGLCHILCLLLLPLGWNCTGKSEKGAHVLPPSKGLPSELLLITSQQVWSSDLQDSLKVLSERAVEGIMQYEPEFKMIHLSEPHYTRRYYTMHSKLFVKLDPRLSKARMSVARNHSAKPQVEIEVEGPSLEALRPFLSQHLSQIRNILLDSQRQMRAQSLSKKPNAKIQKALKKQFGISLQVPQEIRYLKQGQDFLWAGSNRLEKDLNLVVYTLPWQDLSLLDEHRYVQLRDSAMKGNIQGENSTQWMQTAQVDGLPVVHFDHSTFPEKGKIVARGLWEMRNAPTGGPFVSLVVPDTSGHRLLVAEGFIYSPSTTKRELIRTMEASLSTLQFQTTKQHSNIQ